MFLALPDEETVELFPEDLPSETAVEATRRRLLEDAEGHEALAAEAVKEGRSGDVDRHMRVAAVLRDAARNECFRLMLLESSIESLELPLRAITELRKAGINAISTLTSLTREDLAALKIPRRRLLQIEQALAQHNLALKGS